MDAGRVRVRRAAGTLGGAALAGERRCSAVWHCGGLVAALHE